MSIVCRGLGRKGASAALLVTAGLGLGLFAEDVRPNTYGGGHARGDDLALQVARGERGSEGWWGYVAPKPPAAAPLVEARPLPEQRAEPVEIALALPANITPKQVEELQALLPNARNQEEAVLLLALVIDAYPPAPVVTVSNTAPPATLEDEMALLMLLMAAELGGTA